MPAKLFEAMVCCIPGSVVVVFPPSIAGREDMREELFEDMACSILDSLLSPPYNLFPGERLHSTIKRILQHLRLL